MRKLKTQNSKLTLPLEASDATPPSPFEARLAFAAPESATGRFMYMPAGTHVITPSCYGKPVTVVVEVKPAAAAAALNAQLAAVLATRAPQKPYCDFNHDKDRASFWPQRFEAAEDGVYVVGEFSASGRAAVEGKDYRGFSPRFFTDADIDPVAAKSATVREIKIKDGKCGSPAAPAQIICNPNAGLNFGGLVNEPAFDEMQPLFAKNAETAGDSGDGKQQQTNDDDMKKTIADLQAAKNKLEAQVSALEAKASRNDIENAQLEAHKANLHAAEQDVKIAELEAKEVARVTADADAAVARAVKRGAIGAQDSALQAKWKTNCANNPDMISVLDAIAADGSPLTARQAPGATSVQVTGTGPKEVAKAFMELNATNAGISDSRTKIKQAREVYALYAKDIRDNKLFMEMPLEAAASADTVGTLAGTLVAQRTLEFYKYEFPLLTNITSDYSDQPASFNQTTSSRIVTAPALMTYSATIGSDGKPAGWVIATPAATTDANITIDNHKGVEIMFDANALASTARRLFDEQAGPASYVLGKAIVDSLYAKIVAGTFTSNAAFTEASVDFGRRTFAKASRILNQQGVPFSNRFALINSSYFEKLEQDPTLVSLATFQKPEIITDSQLPNISRFTPILAPNLPTTGNMAAFFGHRSSLMVQTRVPNDYSTILAGATNGQVMVVTNPDTGISVLLVQYVSHPGGYAGWRIAAMFGTAVGNEKGGQIVKSA